MIRILNSRRHLRSIRKDERGVTAVEFAIVLPIFLSMVAGMFETGYFLYNRSQLEGAVAKAARDGSLESNVNGGASSIDQQVRELMGLAAKDATLTFTRQSFSKFGKVSQLEKFTDMNGNGNCDNNEPYEDINNSGTRDSGGKAGAGGAKDVVVYEVTMQYDRLFPIDKLFDMDPMATIKARTLVANQPYDAQGSAQVTVRNCT